MSPNIGYTVLLLGVLVFVHELGHFLVAKACGVKVLKFSIGFGPKLIGFTRGDTEYRISWLPLGGYVKMAGDLPGEEQSPEEVPRGFLAQPPWKRGLIVVAGPLFNLIFPVLVFFFINVGPHEVLSNRVGNVIPGMPAAQAGVQPGDRIVAVDGEKMETFEDVRQAISPRFDKQLMLTIDRNGRQLQIPLSPVKNVEVDPVESIPRGMIGIEPVPLPAMVGVAPGSPAAAAGLRSFDRILSINGKTVEDEVALNRVLAQISGELEVKVARSTPVDLPGVEAQLPSIQTLKLTRQPGESYAALGAEQKDLYVFRVAPGSAADKAGIRPGDRILSLNGKVPKSETLFRGALNELEGMAFTLKWRSGAGEKSQELQQPLVDDVPTGYGGAMRAYDLGLRWREFTRPEEMTRPADRVVRHRSVGKAAAIAVRDVEDVTAKTAKGMLALFTGRVSTKSLSGPVGIHRLVAKAAQEGPDQILELMAMISISLGLMNLLPIPVLDGFHLLAAFWEGIRRRPIPPRAREIANMVGLAMLLFLMVWALKNDITQQ